MRLSISSIVTSLLALSQLAIVNAYPFRTTEEEQRDVHDHTKVASRASKGIIVPLQRTGNTWRGSLPYKVIFDGTVPNQQLKEAAIETYNAIKDQYSVPSTLLVAVMYVPGKGFAAGTIWKNSDEYFENMAQTNAPIFWAAVPGINQAVLPNMDADSKWHAEAVAAVVAEEEFGTGISAGRWPAGTKIFTYGKVNQIVAPKPACSEGRSSVRRACKQWLDDLGIETVE